MENRAKVQFLDKAYLELQQFKASMLGMEKEAIYGSSYQIEIYINLYEILVELSEKMPEGLLRKLGRQDTDILGLLYQQWLKKDDSFYQELESHVMEEMYSKEGYNKW